MSKALEAGIVMRSTGSLHQVQAANGESVECRIQGKQRLQASRNTNPVAVGDHIQFERKPDGSGIIREIGERHNYIIRKSVNLSRHAHVIAANIDRAYLIVTLAKPTTSTAFIDRFLVAAEAYRIPVTIVFNKMDIYDAKALELLAQYEATYSQIGYECLRISALDPADIEQLRDRLANHTNLLSGHSGVGKSTLINGIESELLLKTGAVSEQYGEGKHTTTFAEMHPLSVGGFIIDTPGIKGFGIVDIEKEHIAHYFPEMMAVLPECKFSNCVHINEPQCAVKAAVAAGTIAESRYHGYLSIYHSDEEGSYRHNERHNARKQL